VHLYLGNKQLKQEQSSVLVPFNVTESSMLDFKFKVLEPNIGVTGINNAESSEPTTIT